MKLYKEEVKFNSIDSLLTTVKFSLWIKINEELALDWLKKGAIPTDTVKNLLSKAGIMKKFHEQKSGK